MMKRTTRRFGLLRTGLLRINLLRTALLWLGLAIVSMQSATAATVKQEWELDGIEHRQGNFFENSITHLSRLPGFSCQFDQLMAFSSGGGQHYSGTLAVLKPGRFRWQYTKPYAQLYIGNRDSIWHYEPDLMQAERLANLESVDPAVMRLLNGQITPTEINVLQHDYDSELEIRRFQVTMEQSPKVWLGFSNDGDLVYIERQDMLGNSNRMRLSKCSYIAPAANLFSFTPPDGVDVLDLR